MLKSLTLAIALAAVAAPALAAPVETQVEIPSAPGSTLKATLLRPEGGAKGPAVVILPGSGPTDRDGNSPLGVRGSTYRLLAEGLAERGVSSLRMDKRGMFGSASLAIDPTKATVAVLAEDANAWAAKLKAETGVTCVWLLGHSEGGLVALLAAQSGKDICGLILVSAPGRPLATVLREQLHANPANAPLLPAADQAIDELLAGRTFDTKNLPAPLLPLFNTGVQPFLIEMFKHDPAKLAGKVSKPVLILQGETDIQVTADDARALKAGQPKARLVLLPGVNHVLKVAPAERGPNLATYADPSLPLAPGVVEAIVAFVKP